jgi:hypothetical protein
LSLTGLRLSDQKNYESLFAFFEGYPGLHFINPSVKNAGQRIRQKNLDDIKLILMSSNILSGLILPNQVSGGVNHTQRSGDVLPGGATGIRVKRIKEHLCSRLALKRSSFRIFNNEHFLRMNDTVAERNDL